MSIKYAILGLLSWKSLTGYDIKKLMEDSAILYWSGNNNQIYKSLLQLLGDGLVSSILEQPKSGPSKKTYTITDKGQNALKDWVLTVPEAPEFKKAFFVQLAWSGVLNDEETMQLLCKYEEELTLQLAYQKEKHERRKGYPDRNEKEIFLWNKMAENAISSCKFEIDWVKSVRTELLEQTKKGATQT
ncbi:PadR family transcriptional regulator [Clostridium merdae]|uniref:PadR family transcriptional regulator n=1 Tax=Clostridium merdae TaxID=1958780 RepID=UPI000A269E94|nr:PadR family transcriptional regulator [Clostridium merdae]